MNEENETVYAEVDKYLASLNETREEEMFNLIAEQRLNIREKVLDDLEADEDAYVKNLKNINRQMGEVLTTYKTTLKGVAATSEEATRMLNFYTKNLKTVEERLKQSYTLLLSLVEKVDATATNFQPHEEVAKTLEDCEKETIALEEAIRKAKKYVSAAKPKGIPLTREQEVEQRRLHQQYVRLLQRKKLLEKKLNTPTGPEVLQKLLLEFHQSTGVIQNLMKRADSIVNDITTDQHRISVSEKILQENLMKLANNQVLSTEEETSEPESEVSGSLGGDN